jgi:hypothetical protein
MVPHTRTSLCLYFHSILLNESTATVFLYCQLDPPVFQFFLTNQLI